MKWIKNEGKYTTIGLNPFSYVLVKFRSGHLGYNQLGKYYWKFSEFTPHLDILEYVLSNEKIKTSLELMRL